MRFGDKSNFNHKEIIRTALNVFLHIYEEKLKDYKESASNYGEIDWDIRRIKSALESLDEKVTPEIMKTSGGKWLGTARDFIQWEFRNGSDVTWGSDQILKGDVTVADLERLAASVASAAVNEDRGVVLI